MKDSIKTRKLKPSIKRITDKAKNLKLNFEDLTVYGVSKTDGITVTGKDIGKDLGNYFYYEGQKFAYNPYRVNIGSIGLSSPDFVGLISPAYVIFEVDETIYPEFLLLYLKSNVGIRAIKWYGDRGGVRSSLRFSDLGKIDFPDLTYEEQKKFYIGYLGKLEAAENAQIEFERQLSLISKLRQSILLDAVQGKLTLEWRKQNTTIEPASELLKKIKAEKKRLVKEKKLKKTRESGEINEGEFNVTFPNVWITAKLVDLCFITKLAGFEYSKHINLQDAGEVPTIRAQNVKPNRIDDTNLKYIDLETSKLLHRCALTKPSILMTFIGAGIGDTAIFDKTERWHLAPNVAKLEPFNEYGEKISIEYLQLYLMSNIGREQIFKHMKATAQPSLSMGTIRDGIIIIPPLEEQKEIVVKVNQLLSNCDNLEQETKNSKANVDKLMQSVLSELLGEENNVLVDRTSTNKEIKTASREIKYNSKTLLMDLVKLLQENGKLHAEDLWKMSKYYDKKNESESIDKFYAELKKQIEEEKTIKEVEKEKGYLELV